LPFIYRVHGEPTQEKLEEFYSFLSSIGINVKHKKEGVFPKDFQNILKNTENKHTYSLINRVMLRSMQKAKYSPDDIGHFGLSKSHYCHFTSPIRRYPDLMIHRIIKAFLDGIDVENAYAEKVYSVAKQSSEKERNAIEAERAVDDYYKLLYISDYVGEVFDGVISGVTGFGIFVELFNGIEGLVKIETLKGKRRLVHDEQKYTLSDGNVTYKLGQMVKIKVAGVNLAERRAEFVLEESV
jgi:ribonuclease R